MTSKDVEIFAPEIDLLATRVEESARASRGAVELFIEPAQGALRRAKSKRHHIVFGRRGSGKSSLLFKAADELEKAGHPIAFVDLEPFKGHHYPDVLLSVLIAVLRKYKNWLQSHPLGRLGFWQRLRSRLKHFEPKEKRVNERKQDLILQLDRLEREFTQQLHLADEAQIEHKHYDEDGKESKEGGKAGVGVDANGIASASVEREIARRVSQLRSTEVTETTRRSKQDYLHRKVLDLQHLFKELFDLTGADAYLFLDDLYHIRREDQSHLLDYFHRLAKNNSLWLKVGTIKNRSSWYVHGGQPIGLKIGDDADEINLDLTLEKFAASREFLTKILDGYSLQVGAPASGEFVADGGVDRLVIASGGVTRDFLGLFRRSIDETRERLRKNAAHPRGPKIGAEDVNIASGGYGDTKREEFQRDTLDDRSKLEAAFDKLREFCINKTGNSIFLIDQDGQAEDYQWIQELIDLRLIHHVQSRVTVRDKKGELFRALLLDVSQYTGERKRKTVEIPEFWTDKGKEVLRRSSLIYDPTISLDSLRREIEKIDKRKDPEKVEDESQGTLFSE